MRHKSNESDANSRYILCFSSIEQKLWAAAVTVNGQILRQKTKNVLTGRDRPRHFLQLINSVILDYKNKPSAIATQVGPDTPAGVRLNVVLANALSYAWDIKVGSYQVVTPFVIARSSRVNREATVAISFGKWIKAGQLRPLYIHKPNITKSKS